MRKLGKIIGFTPYEEVKTKDGQTVISKQDGMAVMKRTVAVDCGYTTDDGYDVHDGYVCDMYEHIEDSELQKLKDSQEKVAAYIVCDIYRTQDGKYFQRVVLKKISTVNV